MTPEVEHDQGFMSIGEVLNLLVEEFPDVTISKIRFLESQGLISPERTASGYRKFYSEDIDLLRVILTEQKQNFLPLRVIRNRLETGEIDPTGEHLRPIGEDTGGSDSPVGGMRRPTADIDALDDSDNDSDSDVTGGIGDINLNERFDRERFRELAGLTEDELTQLEDFGVLEPADKDAAVGYDRAAVAIARPAGEFLRQGVDARHLRLWRTTAEREASLFEQLVQPRYRQRNPEATSQAVEQLKTLDRLGAELRNAMVQQILRHHFEQ